MRVTQLELISEITQKIASILDLDELLPQVAHLIGDTFGYYNTSILLVEADSDDLILRAGSSPLGEALIGRLRLKIGQEGITGWVVHSGEPLVVNDVSREPRYYFVEESKDTRSELAVPIKLKGEIIGVLDVQSVELDAFNEDDVSILQTLADQLAIAIENARLYEQARESLSRAIESEGRYREMIENARDMIIHLDLEGRLALANKRTEELSGYSRQEVLGRPFMDFICPEYVEDARRWLALAMANQAPGETYEIEFFNRTGERVLVELTANPVEKDEPQGGRVPTGLQIIARDITERKRMEEERARLLAESQRMSERLRASFYQVGTALASSLDLNEVLYLIVELAAGLLDAKVCTIRLMDEQTRELSLRVARGLSDKLAQRVLPKVGQGWIGLVAAQGVPLHIPDLQSDPRTAYPDLVAEEGLHAYLGVPLLLYDEVIGVLSLTRKRPSPFTSLEVELLSSFANQATVAIENARLYEQARESLSRAIESEGRYREMIENARDMIIHLDLEGRLTLANEKAEELSGYSRQEVLGRPFTDFICPEYVEDARRRLAMAIANRAPDETYEIEFFNRTGERVPVELTANPIEKDDPQGGRVPTGLQIIARDVRERKRLEAERAQLLAESQRMSEKLRASFYQVGTALASSLDLDEVLHLIVELAAGLLDAEVCTIRLLDERTRELPLRVARGLSDKLAPKVVFRVGQGLVGLVAAQGVPLHIPDLQNDPRTAYPDVMAEEGLHAYLGVPLLLHDKVVGVLSLSRKHPSPFTSLEVELLSSFAHQASMAIERAELFATVLQEKKESEAIIRNTADGIAIIDHQRRVVDLNPALEQLIGWPREEALGVSCSEFFHGRNAGKDSICEKGCPFSLTVSQDDSLLVEHPITTRDGRQLDVQVSYGPIRDEAGEVSRVIAVVRDISEQKELEHRQSKAETLAAIGDMTGIMAHRMNNILGAARANLLNISRKRARGELAPELVEESLQKVMGSIDKALGMLKTLSRPFRSEKEEEVNVNSCISSALKRLTIPRGIQVTKGYADDIPTVVAAREYLIEVFGNLITNALEAMGDTGRLGLHSQLANNWIEVSVADTGPGIPEELQEKIFELGYGFKKTGEGLGFGLWWSRTFLERLGGSLHLESQVGAGSKFVVRLPAGAKRESE